MPTYIFKYRFSREKYDSEDGTELLSRVDRTGIYRSGSDSVEEAKEEIVCDFLENEDASDGCPVIIHWNYIIHDSTTGGHYDYDSD